MIPEREADRCPVCGQPSASETVICAECESAFGRSEEAAAGERIDLERYVGKMFPWEPSKIAPNLVAGRRAAFLLCFALILIVVLLSLLRAPIPSCWEVG
jgi:hypothetical protein